MGYYSVVHGELIFNPAISDETLEELKSNGIAYWGSFSASGWFGDGASGKAYELESDADVLVMTVNAAGSNVTGSIVVVGEEQPDVWRLVFREDRVDLERAQMRWPDGSIFTG